MDFTRSEPEKKTREDSIVEMRDWGFLSFARLEYILGLVKTWSRTTWKGGLNLWCVYCEAGVNSVRWVTVELEDHLRDHKQCDWRGVSAGEKVKERQEIRLGYMWKTRSFFFCCTVLVSKFVFLNIFPKKTRRFLSKMQRNYTTQSVTIA